MIHLLGNLSLSMVILVAACAVMASALSVRLRSHACSRIADWSMGLIAVLFTLASASLLAAILQSQFQFEYVASYTERALPMGYKIAALWAGQQGSLLLWGWLLGVLSFIAVVGFGDWRGADRSITVAVLAGMCGFFAALILFAANPFTLMDAGLIPRDGRGLNPQLQDLGMIAHPPMLFLGYAGFTIPFAVLVGALAAGRRDNQWLSLIRRWVLFSWVFLTAGIVLGAWWAYAELGWGGYWAWDPVENASLLPWLTATALLHSIMVQRQRGMFKWWNASLISLTFCLCIFSAYITRSGVIQSLHAFGESTIGNFFLVFMTLTAAGTGILLVWRRRFLRPEHELEVMISREGAILTGNILLLFMVFMTLVGTVFPLLSGLFVSEPIVIKEPFYNIAVVPLAILLVFVMAHAPVLAFGNGTVSKMGHAMVIPGVLALLATLGIVFFMRSAWIQSFHALLTSDILTEQIRQGLLKAIVSAAVTFIAALGSGAVLVGLARSLRARQRSTGENGVLALARLIEKDHRRYGGQLAHLGIMLVVIGVAGSSLFSTEKTLRLGPGEAVQIGASTIALTSLNERYEANYSAVEAVLSLTDRDGSTALLRPQRRYYNGWEEQPNTEVAIRSTWREDLYLSLVGWDQAAGMVSIQMIRNPLVVWIWIGGMAMVSGGMLCWLPHPFPLAHRLAHFTRGARPRTHNSDAQQRVDTRAPETA